MSSSTGGGKDKGGKGGGNQWCCPKCGNACTVLEREYGYSTLYIYLTVSTIMFKKTNKQTYTQTSFISMVNSGIANAAIIK